MKTYIKVIAGVTAITGAIVIGCHKPTLAAPAVSEQKPGTAQAQQPEDPRLTHYDLDVASPQVKVGADNKIHVVFVESTKVGIESFVFYRSSTDGGKSFSAPTNLSEDMAGHMVGPCRLAIDGQNRVYAVWRVLSLANATLSGESHQNALGCNLVYRVLVGSQWSPIITINAPTADQMHQGRGVGSFFAGVDPAGRVHTAYVLNTDVFHPDLMFQAGSPYAQHRPGLGNGSIGEVDLNGTTHTAPREAFLSPMTTVGATKSCDTLDLVDGYFDANGAPHLVAQATTSNEPNGQSRIVIAEGGRQTPAVTLPNPIYHQFGYPPALLVDAQGRNHVIVDFAGGEKHSVRDYLGTTGQYTVLKTEMPVNFPLRGFQAGQGPAGTMAVVLEMDDTGLANEGETWIAVFDGKAWRQAVQVTTFKAFSSGNYKALGLRSSVTTVGQWNAGNTGAATFDNSGHFLLVHEADQTGNFAIQGRGVTGVGGGSRSPKLLFHRF